MAIIISYDINAKHTEFKNRMKGMGYKDVIKGIENCDKIYFPNTTLYHSTKTASKVVDNARNLCEELNINLEDVLPQNGKVGMRDAVNLLIKKIEIERR